KFALQTVLLCAVWPASCIFFAGYPESLLLALMLWSICRARSGRWGTAIALGAAAALTKAIGVVVTVPLLMIAARSSRKMIPPILLVPLAAVFFPAYLHWKGATAQAFSYSQFWRTSISPPWKTLWFALQALVHTPDPVLVLNLLSLILVCILAFRSRL